MTIFKACDVRGIVDRDWGTSEAEAIGRSLAAMMHRRGQSEIVVGGDFRRSTPVLKTALTRGLCRCGVTVQDVGQVPTPVVQFAARNVGCRNLAVVTASHNPGPYNGIKFVLDNQPPTPELIAELEQGCGIAATDLPLGTSRRLDIVERYAQWVLEASREFVGKHMKRTGGPSPGQGRGGGRIVIDTMGGAFTQLAPMIVADAGYEVISVDDVLDPEFIRRDPNPAKDANLDQAIGILLRSSADLAVALDGDGDRVVFIDQCGTIARPEQIAALLLQAWKGPCTIVHDLKCASLVARTANCTGGLAVMQPSGHGFIKRRLLELRAELGVEVSGHHFFGALDGGDDGLFTALVVIRLLAHHPGGLAAWLDTVGWPAITPDVRIEYSGDVESLLDRIAKHCTVPVLRLDGVRAEYEQHSWALARASITEPAITFRFEGRDSNHVREIAARFLAHEPELCQQVLERIP